LKIDRRIEALEKRLITEPTLLEMADGTIETIFAPTDHWLKIFVNLRNPEKLTTKQASSLELVKRSIRSEEPGGAGMINVIRVMLAGPVQRPDNKNIVTLAPSHAT
jgi:hypothetical protein